MPAALNTGLACKAVIFVELVVTLVLKLELASVNEPEIPAAVNTGLVSKEETLVLNDELVDVNEPEMSSEI